MKIIVLKAIIAIEKSGKAGTEILHHVAARQRNRRIDTVQRLQQICGAGTSRPAVVDVLRKLESSGFGVFIVGRRGQESRFVWSEE